MSSGAEHVNGTPTGSYRRESVREQARRRSLSPIISTDDLARPDVFESDAELDAFLAHVQSERHANLS
jgi:hypothetical protein